MSEQSSERSPERAKAEQPGARLGQTPVTHADDPPAILAGDADRERSVQALTGAVVEGRLTLEEFSDRVGLVHVSRTQSDLEHLTRDLPAAAPSRELDQAPTRFRAVCSMLVRKGPWELPARSSFRCICGSIMLDLSQARLAGREVEIDVFNLFGTVTLMVPAGIDVSVVGGGMFASEIVETPAIAPGRGAPRLRVSVRGPGGTLYVRSPEPGD